MKIERVSEHIWSIRSWMLIPVKVWVVLDSDGITLVDTGFPYMADGIMQFIERLHAGPLKRILLTHGHSDHVGSVTKFVDRLSIPIYAHRIEIPYMQGELPYPRRKKTENNVPKGLAKPLNGSSDDCLEIVAGLTPYLTPGHSPGHVVYYHEKDKVLLAGDLCTSKGGKMYRPIPMFTADMVESLKSSAIVKQLNPKRLEVCHGNSVFHPAEHLQEYILETSKKFSISTQAVF
jgi:glyoxylase-like metal-dependent hydrolase (beta-lactamase superfamily II)